VRRSAVITFTGRAKPVRRASRPAKARQGAPAGRQDRRHRHNCSSRLAKRKASAAETAKVPPSSHGHGRAASVTAGAGAVGRAATGDGVGPVFNIGRAGGVAGAGAGIVGESKMAAGAMYWGTCSFAAAISTASSARPGAGEGSFCGAAVSTAAKASPASRSGPASRSAAAGPAGAGSACGARRAHSPAAGAHSP